jgi:branched-subunit amino acid ABC-type transport system permease component
MTGGYMLFEVAQRTSERVLNEDLVTAACVALIVASVLWVVLSRLILRNLRKTHRVPPATSDSSGDPWRAPPIRRRR